MMERNIKKAWLNVLHGMLVIMGFVNAILTLVSTISQGHSTRFLLVAFAEVLAFIGIIFYAIRGRKEEDDKYFLGLVYALSGIILCVEMIAATNIAFITLMTIAFGLVLVFADNLENKKKARTIIFAVIVIVVIACFVEEYVQIAPPGASVESLVEPEILPSQTDLGRIGQNASFWSVALLASTVGLAFEYRYTK